jgi:hypothetical protein
MGLAYKPTTQICSPTEVLANVQVITEELIESKRK